ncbi:MAG: hypothetical protein CVT85_03790 [Alphaproteobacteria bacterium HGW-Alphaproteobacteria-7]|nr:MAG: hypothetical protein CVT85_03790 [Alphaproteobacteria bacterium HGW-Alphaproteobacteria-7]
MPPEQATRHKHGRAAGSIETILSLPCKALMDCKSMQPRFAEMNRHSATPAAPRWKMCEAPYRIARERVAGPMITRMSGQQTGAAQKGIKDD